MSSIFSPYFKKKIIASMNINLYFPSDRLIWNLLDWIYPPVCASCGKPGFTFCPACLDKTRLIGKNICNICRKPILSSHMTCDRCLSSPPIYSGMRSWALYEGVVRDGIHSLKYKNNLALGYFFAAYLIPIIKSTYWNPDLIIPVPLSKSHLKDRGYNQSALIARPISSNLRIPFESRALIRNRETSSQVNLTAEERHKNVEDAFSGNPAKLEGKIVLLVDDVITTGATMENCTKALLTAGAKKVYCISVARVFMI